MSRFTPVTTSIAFCIASLPAMAGAGCPDCVVVAVDLDASRPGIQTTMTVPPGTTRIEDVTVWISDPNGAAVIRSIGHVGGLNRGLSFGHVPDGANAGTVTALTGVTVDPVVAGHTAFLNGGFQPMFTGPEVQYFETGAPGAIPVNPTGPVMSIDIDLEGAVEGDVFSFHLGDMTAAWLESGDLFDGGAFSTTDEDSLDAGGDAVPDGTPSLLGIDSDVPVSSPPAPFLVDYIDGIGGSGATIVVAATAVPALSTWAMFVMTAALLAAGATLIRNRAAFKP